MEKLEALEKLRRISSAKDVMRFFDANGDMVITEKELRKAMEPICGTDENCYYEAMEGFNHFDQNGDNLVDVEEVIDIVDNKDRDEFDKDEREHDKDEEDDWIEEEFK